MKARFSVSMIALLALVWIASLSGCAPAAATPKAAEQLPVVRYVNFKVYDPVYVAIDQGFFTKRGINVEIVGDVLAGPTGIQAVAGGSAEAGLSSLPAIINANAAGLPIIGVSDIQSSIKSKNQHLERYYVRADSDLRQVADVVGHTWAVNLWRSSFHYTALYALDQLGISPDSVNWVLLSFDRQADALVQGSVDIIGLMEPYQSYAQQMYGDQIRELFTDIDVMGDIQLCTHFMNRVWADSNPEKARAFVDGVVDAIVWIEGHQQESRAIQAKYTGIPETAIPEYWFQPTGRVNMSDVQRWMNYLTERGDLTATWVTADMVATNKYNSRMQ